MLDDMEPVWMLGARRAIGTKEVAGAGANPEIVKYHAETRLHATSDEIAWCSSFVNAMFAWNGIEPTRSAAARSWLKWGVKLDKPRIGCVVVLERHSAENPNAAHVAFYAGESDHEGMVKALGGNQANRVCVRDYPKDRVLGYRWPDGVP